MYVDSIKSIGNHKFNPIDELNNPVLKKRIEEDSFVHGIKDFYFLFAGKATFILAVKSESFQLLNVYVNNKPTGGWDRLYPNGELKDGDWFSLDELVENFTKEV